MPRHTTALVLVVVGLFLGSCTTLPKPAPTDPLILISIDGFRWDYLQKYEAPTLRQLAATGVHATRMTASFPSKTFPNHYTLVTGLYPAHHGIVGNWFSDPATGETFGMNKPESNSQARWWAAGEPVWITAEKQGVRSACYFWPGSEVENHGVRPSRFKAFDGKLTSFQRVDELLSWLAVPAAERPRFCTLYFDVVDHAGHKYGPDAPETGAAVKEADDAVARLLAGLAQLGLRDHAGLVIVSDHGMSSSSTDKVIFLEDLMNVSQVLVDSTGPTGGVRPKPGTGSPAELAAHIRAKAPPQLHVYLRNETPAQFHYRDNPLIPDVVLLADDHWEFSSKVGWPNRKLTFNKGDHGWDPTTPNMGALFIANGPAFRHGVEIPDVVNIHVYNLLCAALGIKPAANDGDDRLGRAALR
ncbi:MAG: Type phosphodiesterase / nucleotide pyrophosphatase [Lacunisphaera sp.]|nr:Type phosphodiesterase / nucleotide pyrophosphatase [Lacunisphaera sp.]